MTESTLNTPVLWINLYLQEKLGTLLNASEVTDISSSVAQAGVGIPFFPTRPSSLDELTEQWVTINDVRYPFSGLFAVWDRMFRMRRGPFPHIKTEQVLYYFYSVNENATEKMVQVQELTYRLLDRGDESAEDINEWARRRGSVDLGGNSLINKFYFHDFKIFQLEEARDIIDFGTARTYAGNKIIIDYTYHQMPELTNNDFTL
jgi:hypothetical protein